MKILIICQYYYPEPFRITDLCEELVKRGHEVTVVTGEPNYPEGEIYKGYENHAHSDEIENGVTVHRCHIIPRKSGTLYRFLNYISYPMVAKKYIKNLLSSNGKPFDVVFVNQLSPVMMAEPAIAYKKKYGIPVLLYCLDLWPESLVAGGIKRKSLIFRVFHNISKRIYRSVDKILVTSKMFKGYLINEFGISGSSIDYLPQYAEDLFEPLPYKKTFGITDLVFAGNIGDIQSVETIINAANKLQDKPIRFHIVGSGTDLDRLKKISEKSENVIFYGRRPLEEMPDFYAKADAMLVTLKADPVLNLTLPGKIQSYMAAGKPIIGAVDGEAAEIIKDAKCGYCGKADDASELSENIIRFLNCDNKEQLGSNARAYYESCFGRQKYMARLEEELKRLCVSF